MRTSEPDLDKCYPGRHWYDAGLDATDLSPPQITVQWDMHSGEYVVLSVHVKGKGLSELLRRPTYHEAIRDFALYTAHKPGATSKEKAEYLTELNNGFNRASSGTTGAPSL